MIANTRPAFNAQCSLLDCARAYFALGFTLFPLCDKVPVVPWKYYQDPDHRPDDGQFQDWFSDLVRRAWDGGRIINGIGIPRL